MRTLSIYLFILGLAWGFFPNTGRYAFSKNGILASPYLGVASQSSLFVAADESIFMGFGSKNIEEKRNEVSTSCKSENNIAESSTDPWKEVKEVGTIPPVHELPAPSANSNIDDAHILEVDGPSVAMSELGPIIVNTDGTLRRIENWAKLTKAEQASTFRMVARRNKKRLEALKSLEAEEEELQKAEHGAAGAEQMEGAIRRSEL